METTMRKALLDSETATAALDGSRGTQVADNAAAMKTWWMTGSEVAELNTLDQAVQEVHAIEQCHRRRDRRRAQRQMILRARLQSSVR